LSRDKLQFATDVHVAHCNVVNQRSPHSHGKVAQNRALLYSEKELRDC